MVNHALCRFLLHGKGQSYGKNYHVSFGITAEMFTYERFFDLQMMPTMPVLKEQVAKVGDAGADAVILLSHMGVDADREIAAVMQGELALILGGHSHSLLPEGEWVGNVLIAQAGEYAQHLGRVDLEWDGRRLSPTKASVIAVTEAISPSPDVQGMVEQIELVKMRISRQFHVLPIASSCAKGAGRERW